MRAQSTGGTKMAQLDAPSSIVALSDGVVLLRPWSKHDAGFMAQANTDPLIRRYNGKLDRHGWPGPLLSVADAEATIDGFALSWQTFQTTANASGVAFAVIDASSGQLAGCCGVDEWTDTDVAQFGYWLAPEARGRGYASRAAVLMTRWLFELGAARVSLKIVAGNDASVAVARRAGFEYEGTMRAYGIWQGERCDVMLFAALPETWNPVATTDSRGR